MIVKKYETIEEWKQARETAFTGTKVAGLKVKPRTAGIVIGEKLYNETTAEMAVAFMTTPDDREGIEWQNDAQRGIYLEKEALEATSNATGVKFIKHDCVIWYSNDAELIGLSPDGVDKNNKIALETKCLGSVKHLKYALLAKKCEGFDRIPQEYQDQVAQYFLVNPDIEKVCFSLYDPRFDDPEWAIVPVMITRKEAKDKIAENATILQQGLNAVKEILAEINTTKTVSDSPDQQ